MKISNFLFPFVTLALVAGCQSHEPNAVSRTSAAPPQNAPPSMAQQDEKPDAAPSELKPDTTQQFTVGNVTYTVESIPETRLTPTSREGDVGNRVYTSNMIMVRVRTNGVSATNNSQLQAK